MYRIVKNSVLVTTDGKLRARLNQGALTLLAALCLFILPTFASAECGNFGLPGAKAAIKLPAAAHADFGFPTPFERPTVVGLWHVIYTAGGSTFNDTFDTWHADGTEFETAYLPAAAGNGCVGVWVPTGHRSVKLHHLGWVFDSAAPMATATNYFTLDEEVTVLKTTKPTAANSPSKYGPLTEPPA